MKMIAIKTNGHIQNYVICYTPGKKAFLSTNNVINVIIYIISDLLGWEFCPCLVAMGAY